MPTDDDLVTQARQLLETDGPSALLVGDLTVADLPHIAWSGDPHHLTVVRDALDRVAVGDLAYLALRLPNGLPVAKACLDFARYPDAGYLSQLATHPRLQGLGLGSRLMAGVEERTMIRGRHAVRICVEHENIGARSLYERLGFAPIGEALESWGRTGPDGEVVTHCAEVTLMRKSLA